MKSRHETYTKYKDFVKNSQKGGMNVHRGRLYPQRGSGLVSSLIRPLFKRIVRRGLKKGVSAAARVVKSQGAKQVKKQVMAAVKKKAADLVEKGIDKGVSVLEKSLKTKLDPAHINSAKKSARGLIGGGKKKKKKPTKKKKKNSTQKGGNSTAIRKRKGAGRAMLVKARDRYS